MKLKTCFKVYDEDLSEVKMMLNNIVYVKSKLDEQNIK